jgi:hypothetical protein
MAATERQILHGITHLWNMKKLNLQVESRIVITKIGEGMGERGMKRYWSMSTKS